MRRFRRLAACLTALCALAFPVQSAAAAYTETTVTIPVSCLNVGAGSHIYEIYIERENEFSPVPLSDTLHIAENGTGEFTIVLSEPGTFEYRIYENPGEDEKIQYDDTLYEVTVYVTCEVDDMLQYAVTVLDHSSGKKPEKLEFRNLVLGETDVNTTTAPYTTDDSYTGTVSRSTNDDSFTDVNTTESNSTGDDSYTDSNSTTIETTSSDSSGTQSTESSPRSSTATTRTVTTTAPSDSGTKPTLSELAGSVLTGDNAPLALLFGAMSAAALTGGVTLLLKRREDDDDDDNTD